MYAQLVIVRRSNQVKVAALTAAVLVLLGTVIISASASAAVIPRALEASTIASGLAEPMAVAFVPDKRVFIAEKRGVVKVVLPGEAPSARTLFDISDHVATRGDHGLIGITADADFSHNGFLYLLYTRDANPRDTDGPKTARLSRITVGAGAKVESGERVILGTAASSSCQSPGPMLDCLPSDRQSHGIGTVRSSKDGTLWVGIGDGMWAGTLAWSIERALNPAVMSAAILHIDRDGKGLASHPFCVGETNLRASCTKVFAKGLRNPFRFQILSDGRLVAGDVGWNAWEEVNLIKAGHSYGWPCFEGGDPTPGYTGDAACAPYTDANQTRPLFRYAHVGDNGAAIVMGPQLGSGWPAAYRGKAVFSDYVLGNLRALDLAHPDSASTIMSALGGVVDIESTPSGGLAFVDPATAEPAHLDPTQIGLPRGSVWTLTPSGAGQRPWPQPTLSSRGLEIRFRSGTSDAATSASRLTYHWDFGDGKSSADANPIHRYTKAGVFTAKIRVSDGRESGYAVIRVNTGLTAPKVTITTPTSADRSIDGAKVNVSGTATLNGKTLPAGNLSWLVQLHHGSHTHNWTAFYGRTGSFTTAEDHDVDSYYTIVLRATAESGATASKSVNLLPLTRTLTLGTNVSGITVGWGGISQNGPRPTAVGYVSVLSAPSSWTGDGKTWNFVRWSDDVTAATRIVKMPNANTALTAIYVPAGDLG